MKRFQFLLMLVITYGSFPLAAYAAPDDEPAVTYTVKVKSANETKGTVYIRYTADTYDTSVSSITVEAGTQLTLVAQPKNGYKFAYWSDNSVEATHTVTVDKNITYTAYFANNISSGNYTEIGTTDLYSYITSNSIDVKGLYNGTLYRSTYSDGGYRVAMKVGSNSAAQVNCLTGSTMNGVTCVPSIVQQGNLARMIYTVTNSNSYQVSVSIGTHADVMIGSNDRAPITRRIDLNGNTYGLTMRDNSEAQLCVLFGAGLSGVTPISDFWFGYYYTNYDASNMVGNYSSGSNYMQENGSYDSGMGWCWKNIPIEAGETKEFAILIGVGEVNLTPYSDLLITPVNSETWNDLDSPHSFIINGSYSSPAGLAGVLEYAVETTDEWITLTGELHDGDSFYEQITIYFDPSLYTHTIFLRTRDNVGNTSNLPSAVYDDIRKYSLTGISDSVYTGRPIMQNEEHLQCEIHDTLYVITNYRNNVNAGTAQFDMEGVCPYTIGRTTYEFGILPQPLKGNVYPLTSEFVFDGNAHTSSFAFSEYEGMTLHTDYDTVWTDNVYPGYGTLIVTGKGNYTGSLTTQVFIDKASLPPYTVEYAELVLYDGTPHWISAPSLPAGAGQVTFSYEYRQTPSAEWTPADSPVAEGEYKATIRVADGNWYYGNETVVYFSIFNIDLAEWEILQRIHTDLSQRGWSDPWDLSNGPLSVVNISDLKIQNGHVMGLYLRNKNLNGTFPVTVLELPNLETLVLSGNNFTGALENIPVDEQDGLASLTRIEIQNNAFEGNIGAFAAIFPNLVYLDAADNRLSEVSPMVSANVTYLNIRHQYIPLAGTLDLTGISLKDALFDALPQVVTYNHTNRSYNNEAEIAVSANPSFSAYATQDGWSCSGSSDNRIYRGQDGGNVQAVFHRPHTTEDSSYGNYSVVFNMGDVDFDGLTDVTDLQSSVRYIFGQYDNCRLFNFTAADLYADGDITVQDVVLTVDLLLGTNESLPQHTQHRTPVWEQEDEPAPATLTWKNGELHLFSTEEIAAVDLIVSASGAVQWITLDGQRIKTSTDGDDTHAVIYSMKGVTFPAMQDIVIARLSAQSARSLTLKVAMSDADANRVRVALHNETGTVTSTEATATEQFRIRTEIGRITVESDNSLSVCLYDASGKLIETQRDIAGGVSLSVAQGVYLLHIEDNATHIQSVKKVVIR